MAENFQFELVSPERRLASVEAASVLIPAAEGDMTVMAEHAPVITTLRPGILKIESAGESQEFVVTGGFAEITAEIVTVLAEIATPASEARSELVDNLLEKAREAAASAEGDSKDTADKQVADLEALKVAAGL